MSAKHPVNEAFEQFTDQDQQTFGQLMREYRHRKSMSLTDLEKETGKHWTYLSKLELDKFPPPASETIESIAQALAVDPDILFVAAGRVPIDLVDVLSHSMDSIKDVRRLLNMPYLAPQEKKSE